MKQLSKVFLMNQFGSPFEWNQKWIDNVQRLGEFGFDFKIFTPNKLESKGNVEIVPMTIEEFNELVEKKVGINPNMHITPEGIPSFHITDFIVAYGALFNDYTNGYDFWGATGFDDVFGRLEYYLPDNLLSQVDIFSDDVNAMNGNFCLLRNNDTVNNLFKQIPDWEKIFRQKDCPGCNRLGDHFLYCPDEYAFNQLMPEFVNQGIRFRTPKYYSPHSHDRLENHRPFPKLKIEEDGSLWELLEDVGHPKWEHGHDFFGREIAYFHFQRTKKWPL